jgi:hypothetical protein
MAGWAAASALAVGLLLVAPIAAATWLKEISALQTGSAADAEFSELVERVRATPGQVFGDPLDVVVLADPEPQFEPLMLTLLEAAGRWDTGPLNEQLCRGGVSLIVVETPLESVGWPDRLRATASQTMELESVSAGRLLYRPKSVATATERCPSVEQAVEQSLAADAAR